MGDMYGVDASKLRMTEIKYTKEDFDVLLKMISKRIKLYNFWNDAINSFLKYNKKWDIGGFRRTICGGKDYSERIIFWISYDDLPLFINAKSNSGKEDISDIQNIYIPWRFKIGK